MIHAEQIVDDVPLPRRIRSGYPLHEVKPRTEGDAPETFPWGV
jgi:hypothetical protein